MTLLTREGILGADDRVTEDVDCPEWGGSVRVASLSGKDRDAYEASLITVRGKNVDQDMRNIRAKLVCRVIIDEKGERLFTEQDVAVLGAKNAAALDRVYLVAARLSGLNKSAVEDAEGNSEPAPADGSTSD